MNCNKIREKFLEFFRSKNHEIVPSAPMVIKDDPTLMFTNAGMNQFKDLFLGNAPIKYPRIANSQKCLRVSGKHNDLEEVGVDTYHHTMFEMLGNWSFGDYFKKEAIEWSWELLVGVYKIDTDRIYVTVFEGSKEENIPFDQESFDNWKRFISADRIINGNKKDNFWEMGDTGPCGPCTEIHVDLRDDKERKKISGRELVNTGNPHVIEIWNNVFMEFNRKADGTLEKLPSKHVDTGMGFERLCMVLQQKKSNYDTDLFKPLIDKIENLSGLRYKPEETTKSVEIINIAIRVIADHIRTISFSIADGQLPSNTGAGYVIRRILRRAVRYGYQSLNLKEPFLFRLVPVLANHMGEAFPELQSQKLLIEKVIKEEETSFYRTLETGLKKIDQVCIELINKNKSQKTLDGKIVFELYDTFGFPIDLTSLIARGYGLNIDETEFNKELEIQKNRSRAATATDAGDWIYVNNKAETTKESKIFIGYEKLEAEVEILKYRNVKSKNKAQIQLVLNQTPFYAESGGQVGDSGILENSKAKITIIDTKKENGEFIHLTDAVPSDLSVKWIAKVNAAKRKLTQNNHSATHLLHAALRKILGTHVEQKGSLVNDEYLRFDFSHFSKVTDEELNAIEREVNEKIRANIFSNIKEMPISEAKKLGAMALFGEKYGDTVRVVTFDPSYSIELCGGTHVHSTAEIGLFKITSESAVAAGIRRIEAITSVKAEGFINDQIKELLEIKSLLKNPKNITKAIQQLIDDSTQLSKQVEKLYREKAKQVKEDVLQHPDLINGVAVYCKKIDLDNAEAVKDIAFSIKSLPNTFTALGAIVNGKPSLTIAISDDIVNNKKLNAGQIIRELAKEINGGGGGQSNYATAGGTNVDGLDLAISKAKNYIQ